MGETVERRLKDINGLHVYKVTDNKGMKNEKTTYVLINVEENQIKCFATLKELKEYVSENIK